MGWHPRPGGPYRPGSAVTPPRHNPSALERLPIEEELGEDEQPTEIRQVDPLVAAAMADLPTPPPPGPQGGQSPTSSSDGSPAWYGVQWPGHRGDDVADAIPTVLEPGAAQTVAESRHFEGFAGGLFDDNVVSDSDWRARESAEDASPPAATMVEPNPPQSLPDQSRPDQSLPDRSLPAQPLPAQAPPARSPGPPGADSQARQASSPRPIPWFITRTTVGLSAGILGLFVGLMLIPALAAPDPQPVTHTVRETATATATTTATATATSTATTTATTTTTATATQTVTAEAPVAPVNGQCPAAAPIKGDQTSMTFFVQTSAFYAQVQATHCFATPEQATAAGFQPAPG
ncbi:hypothetical protein ACQCX2_05910 [Propionibacteriaceae bacterium Y1700]|uniref:sunset domain-containing protein n=1 Tax=Microlunatus sp. Y1700 TaxID=3418487 RepID=UPI003DA70AD7